MVKTTEFNVQTQMNYVVGNMSGFTAAYTGMDNLSALLSSLMTSYTTMAGTGRAAYLSLGAAISAVGLKSAEAFGEYQRGMNMVKAISNNTNAQMQMLSQSAQQFSGQFRMGIEDINDGLVTLGRAGLTDVNNQIEVLKNGLQVAKISGMDLASTLEDIVTTTSLLGGDIKSNTFGAETKEISNLLVATSLSGPLNVSDVIETLKFAGGSAAAAGATLNNEEGLHDLLGTIGAFSQKGVTGSIAGTALRAFITKPASQDQKVSDALAKLGLDAYSLWEKDPEQGWHMKPIAEQIGMITKAMNDNHLTNLDRIEVWGDIVGNKMGQQMLKLDENRIKETTKDIEHQRNLEDIYQGTLTNFASQVERLNQIFQAIYRNVGSGFASMLTGIVQGFADVLEFLNSIGNGVLFKMIAPILGPLGLYGLAKGLKDFVELLGMLKANIQSSLERPIKGQALYQPYEDWETSRRGGGYGGIIRSSGTVNITGPTTVQSTGQNNSQNFIKSLISKQTPQRYDGTVAWQNAEKAARERFNTESYRLKDNVFTAKSQYDLRMKDPTQYTESELANLQKYEAFSRALRYVGKKLIEDEQLLNKDGQFTDQAIKAFSATLGLTGYEIDALQDLALGIPKNMAKYYPEIERIDPLDPDGERINPQYAYRMLSQMSKRALDQIYKRDYGENADFYRDMVSKGMDATAFGGYVNIPEAKFHEKVRKENLEGEDYVIAKEQMEHQKASMRSIGAFNYLGSVAQHIGTGDQKNAIMVQTVEAVSRGLENINFSEEVGDKVKNELSLTVDSINNILPIAEQEAKELGYAVVRGYVREGLGIRSPGKMRRYTRTELEGIKSLLQQYRLIYNVEGKSLGDALSNKFIAFDMETTGTVYNHSDLNRNDSILTMGAALFENGRIVSDKQFNTADRGIIRYKTDGTENPIKPEAAKVNKLSYDESKYTVDQFLNEELELREFQQFVEGVLGKTIDEAIMAQETIDLVAHNGIFDLTMLENTINRVNMAIQESGSNKSLIPDITKVLSLIDTMEVGQKAIKEKYGIDIQKAGPEDMMSLGIKYKSPWNENEELFIGDNKLESYNQLTGVRKGETHDALQDAIDAGEVSLRLANGLIPDGDVVLGTTLNLIKNGLDQQFKNKYGSSWVDTWLDEENAIGIKNIEGLFPMFQGFNFENLAKFDPYVRHTGLAFLQALQTIGLTPEMITGFSPYLNVTSMDDLHNLSERDILYNEARATSLSITKRAPTSRQPGQIARYHPRGMLTRLPPDHLGEFFEGESTKAYDDQRVRSKIGIDDDLRAEYLSKRQMEFDSKSVTSQVIISELLDALKGNKSVSSRKINNLFETGILDYVETSSKLIAEDIAVSYNKNGRRIIDSKNSFYEDGLLKENFNQEPKFLSAQKGLELFFSKHKGNEYLQAGLISWLENLQTELNRGKIYEKQITVTPKDVHNALLMQLQDSNPNVELLQTLTSGKFISQIDKSFSTLYSDPDITSIVDRLLIEGKQGSILSELGEEFAEEFNLYQSNYPNRDALENKVRQLLNSPNGEDLPNKYIPDNVRLVRDEENSEVRATSYQDYTEDADTILTNKYDPVVDAILSGKVPGLNSIRRMVNYVNRQGQIWSIKDDQVGYAGFDRLQWADVDDIEADLLEMERVFKNNNKQGAYFNFNNLQNPLDSFRILDDIPEYQALKSAFEEKSGFKWVGGDDYISHDQALQNLINLGEDGVKKIMERTPYGFAPNMLPSVRNKAISYAQKNAVADRPIYALPKQSDKMMQSEIGDSKFINFKKNLKLMDTRKDMKTLVTEIKALANSFGLSLKDMVVKVGEETVPFGTALRNMGSGGMDALVEGLQMNSPPRVFTMFLEYVRMLPSEIQSIGGLLRIAAFDFGRNFVAGFRDGIGFHSPIVVIEEFKKQLQQDWDDVNVMSEAATARLVRSASSMMSDLKQQIKSGKESSENVLFELNELAKDPRFNLQTIGLNTKNQRVIKEIFGQADKIALGLSDKDIREEYRTNFNEKYYSDVIENTAEGHAQKQVKDSAKKQEENANQQQKAVETQTKASKQQEINAQRQNNIITKQAQQLVDKSIHDIIVSDIIEASDNAVKKQQTSKLIKSLPESFRQKEILAYQKDQLEQNKYKVVKSLPENKQDVAKGYIDTYANAEDVEEYLDRYGVDQRQLAKEQKRIKERSQERDKIVQGRKEILQKVRDKKKIEKEKRLAHEETIAQANALEAANTFAYFGSLQPLSNEELEKQAFKAFGQMIQSIDKQVTNTRQITKTHPYYEAANKIFPLKGLSEKNIKDLSILTPSDAKKQLDRLSKATFVNLIPDANAELRKKLFGDIFEQPVHEPKLKGTKRTMSTPISDPSRDLRMKIFGDVFKNAGKNITKSKISPEQKIQQRNQRAIEKWTQELIKGSMTQEQYAALLEGLTLSGQNFEVELQKANANLLKFSNELLTGTFEDDAARDELRGKIQQEIATIETLNEAKRRETTASIAAAEADRQESVTGRLSGFASAVGGMAGKLANGMFGLMMNPYVMVAQMVWGYVQQGIEMIRQQEEEKIAKLSEIASNAESSYDEQTSKWEDAQSKANEKFGDLSDNEKQDQMLEAIQKAREDNNSASAETKALLGKQNALISSSDNMINAKTNQRLTGYNGLQANWEEFMQGSGMVGSKDEFGLMDYLEGLINPDKFKDDSNTARIQAMADATIQIDTRVKNMEEMTEDYQKVMASFGVAGRSMLDIYNVRGILSDDFFSGTFFDSNSSQRIGAPGFRSAEQLASLMKKEEKILQRFENRYLRFTRSTTGQGDRITVTLGEGSIHNLANQLGVKDVEAAQMLAVHELQRIQDVMINQVEPQLAQTAISMYQGAYSLEQNKNLNDVQAAFQNTMTQGIFAIQAQVAQLVYKATMEQALADYQAATGDTETDTIGLLLNRARDTSYEYHDEAKQFASQGWGGFMQARDLNHLVNQGYTQEQAMNKLLEQGKDSDYYKKLYGEQLGKFEYNSQDGQLGKALIQGAFGPLLGREINEYLDFNNNKYSDFTEYTDWMMKSYAENVPLDEAIKTLNDAQTAADEEGDNGKDTDTSDADKQRYVQLAICNKKAIPKLNVNLFKKAPTFTVLNKNFKLRDIKINTADKAKNIENSLKNAIIDVQERSDPKIIQDSEGEYDPVGATDDATNLPTGASLTK